MAAPLSDGPKASVSIDIAVAAMAAAARPITALRASSISKDTEK